MTTTRCPSFQTTLLKIRFHQSSLRNYFIALVFAILPTSAFSQTWTGAGADDFWFNTLNWSPGVAPNSSTANAVVGAPSPTIVNGNVGLNSLTIDPSGQVTLNPGLSLGFSGAATTTLSNSGTMTMLNGSFLELQFGVVNGGLIDVQAGTSATTLGIPGGTTATLSGGGTINLSGVNARIIRSGSGTALLSLVDQTVQGQGQVTGFVNIDNQGNGLIHANSTGNTLAIALQGAVTSQGFLRASNGGILALASSVTNTGGTIEALTGSEVQLSNSMTIAGGTLSSSGSGLVRVIDTANLSNLTFNGNLELNNGATAELRGAISNTGSILVNAGVNATSLAIDVPTGTTLSGGGTITLSGANARITRTDSGTALLTIADQTIQGQGQINSFLNVANQANGLIHANSTGNTLAIALAGAAVTNQGVLRASSGGILALASSVNNTGGLIEAQAGSEVQLSNSMTITGGNVLSSGTGLIRVTGSGNLSNTTLSGNFELNDGAFIEMRGTINNTGNILVNSGADVTTLSVDVPTGTTLSGGGTITLSGPNARITRTDSGSALLTIADQTIQGQGSIGSNSFMSVLNQSNGLIHANSAGNILAVDLQSGGYIFSNAGTVRASNGGTLYIDRGFVSSGTIDAGAGSMIDVEGSMVSTSSGLITGSGLLGVNSQLSSSGTIAPGNSVGTLVIDVNGGFNSFSMGSTSIFAVELASASSYDVLDINAIASLNGLLTVELLGGFIPGASDVFTILTTDNVNPLSQPLGMFINGSTVTTLGNQGTFTISYVNNNQVQLSNFTAIPEPGSAWLCLIAGVFAISRRRLVRG